MPFDAELPINITVSQAAAAPVVEAADPALELAQSDPSRLLAFLYVSPRPCAALDALLAA
ncbi:MAG TPA: hypothetical protein VF559_03425 [Caulobacteraceae bacterium]|jgi:hypothetical protein